MSKKPQTLVDKYIDKSYDQGTAKIMEKNIQLSMKLSGLLSMLDAYFTEYQQNKKEIVKIANQIVLAEPWPPAKKKEILRVSKNQVNKLDNQEAAFDKFVKRFAKEFDDIMGQSELPDQLIDVFEKFWTRHVKVDETTVTIKEYKYN